MAIGFSLYDTHGRKQVTDNAIDLVYKHKIVVNDYLENNDLVVALQPNANKKIYRLDTVGRIKNRISGYGYLYVFDFNYTSSAENKYGLEVYDKNGNLTFTSNLLSLNIIDDVYIENINETYRILNGETSYFSKNYGSTDIAVIPLISPMWWSSGNAMSESYYIKNGCLRVSSAVFLDDVWKKSLIIESFTLHFLVIDTSNYK